MVKLRHVRPSGMVRLLLPLGAFLLVGCQALGMSGPAGAQRNEIGDRLVAWTAAAHPGDRIALSNLTDFAWDRVLIGSSYFPSDAAEDQLGFAWDAEKLPSHTNEGLNFLAFVAGDHVVAWSTVERRADIAFPPDAASLVSDDQSAVLVWDGDQLTLARS